MMDLSFAPDASVEISIADTTTPAAFSVSGTSPHGEKKKKKVGGLAFMTEAPLSGGDPLTMPQAVASPANLGVSGPLSTSNMDMMAASFQSPRKVARQRLLAKNKGNADSDDSDDDAGDRGAGGVKFQGSTSAASRSQLRQQISKPTLLNVDYPGIDGATGIPRVSDLLPLDHCAVQAIVESVTNKDPSLAHDRNVSRFVRTKEFSHMSLSVFWHFAMQCKVVAFDIDAHDRIMRGENIAQLNAQAQDNRRMEAESAEDAFKVAALAYGATFGRMMARQGHAVETAVAVRDSLFERLPILLAKTVYYLLTLAFSSSNDHKQFTSAIKEKILTMVSQWITGVDPQNAEIQAASQWPVYTRRKEVKASVSFDAGAMGRKLDETSAAAFSHAASMRAMQNDFGAGFAGFAGFRRKKGDDEISRTGSLRRGMSSSRLRLNNKDASGGGQLGAGHGSFAASHKTGASGSERGSTKDTLVTHSIASPRSVALRPTVPNLHDSGRWYEQGGVRGSLCVERVTDRTVLKQAWSITSNSPLIAYYLEQMNIQKFDPGQAGKPMSWTTLAPLDRKGTTLKFGAHAAPKTKKAAAYCREDRRCYDQITERSRRDIVAGHRARRFNEGKAKLASLHIRAAYSLDHSGAKDLYVALRQRLKLAIDKANRRGDAHITEVINLANSALRQTQDYIHDIPYPASAELQRLSIQCVRVVCRLNRFHKVVMDENAAKEHLTYHSVTDQAAAALHRIFETTQTGVPAEDEDLVLLLKDAAQVASVVNRRKRIANGEDVSSSEEETSEDEAEDATRPDPAALEKLAQEAEDWVTLPGERTECFHDDEHATGGGALIPLTGGSSEAALAPAEAAAGDPLTGPARTGTVTPASARSISTRMASSSSPHAGSKSAAEANAARRESLSIGAPAVEPLGTGFHGSKRPSTVGRLPLASGTSWEEKQAELAKLAGDYARMPATARESTRRAPSPDAAQLLAQVGPTPDTSRPGSTIGGPERRATHAGGRGSRNKQHGKSPHDSQKMASAWLLAKEPKPDRSRPPSVMVVHASDESVVPSALDPAALQSTATAPAAAGMVSNWSPGQNSEALISAGMPTVSIPTPTFHTQRSSRESPASRSSPGLGQSKVPAPPREPKLKFTSKRHSVRHTMDPSDSTAKARDPPKSSALAPPPVKVERLPWWQEKDESDAPVVVESSDSVRRPETTPHFQRGTAAQQIKTAGVTSVSLSVERQVAMATAAAQASPNVPSELEAMTTSIRMAAMADSVRPSGSPRASPRATATATPRAAMGMSGSQRPPTEPGAARASFGSRAPVPSSPRKKTV